MESAWARAKLSVSHHSLVFSDLRLPSSDVVLLVTAPGCEHCAAFETEHAEHAERVASDLYRGATLVPWNCDTAPKRDVAVRSGCDDVPCIVVVPSALSGRPPEVVDAFQFARRAQGKGSEDEATKA